MTTALATTGAAASPDERLDFADYVARRRPALLRSARAIAGDAGSAEDLLQCALMHVLPHWSSIREPSAADAYTRRAMHNQHVSWCRQKSRRQERPFADVPDVIPVWDSHPGTDTTTLWRLVAALPPAQRSAIALRYYEGLSVREAARTLGTSPGTVKSNASRGLASLRRSLVQNDSEHDFAV